MNIFDIINEPIDSKVYDDRLGGLREIYKLNLFLHSFEKNIYICLHGRNYSSYDVKWRDTFLESVFKQTIKDKRFENSGYMRLILSFVNTNMIAWNKIGRF